MTAKSRRRKVAARIAALKRKGLSDAAAWRIAGAKKTK